jgi:hypothetical protein
MEPFTVAQMISDGRAEARKLHELAERADLIAQKRVGVGPPRDLTADEQALIDYVRTLREAHGAIMLALDRCPDS